MLSITQELDTLYSLCSIRYFFYLRLAFISNLGIVVVGFPPGKQLLPFTSFLLQELIAVADADGILRTYRPASIGNPLFSQNGVEDGTGLGVMIRPFELIVECRLGACPALCEFALETKERKQNQTKARQGSQHREEVLRTCTRDGGLRVWPSSSLPKRPARLPAMAQVEPPSPPQAPSIPSDTSIAKALNNIPNELETAEAGYEQHNGDSCEPFARWIAVEAAGGSVEQGEKEAAEQPSVARGNAPLPRVRPLAPRRVSFAPAEQVYRFQDPYTSTSQQPQELKQQHQEDEEYKKREHDDELEGPRPPPPAPMLAPSASSSKISRPRQAWRISPLEGNGKRGSTTSKGMSMLTSTSEGEDLSVYLTPSRLQEPSMWSTAMEQAMLERRLREVMELQVFVCRFMYPSFRGPPPPILLFIFLRKLAIIVVGGSKI